VDYNRILEQGIEIYHNAERTAVEAMFHHGVLIAKIDRAGDSDSAYYNATMKYAESMEKADCIKSRTYWLNCIKTVRLLTTDQCQVLLDKKVPYQYVVMLLSGVYEDRRGKIIKMIAAGCDIPKQFELRKPVRKYASSVVKSKDIIETDTIKIDPEYIEGIRVLRHGDVDEDALETHLRALVSKVGKEILITTLNSIPDRQSKYADLKI